MEISSLDRKVFPAFCLWPALTTAIVAFAARAPAAATLTIQADQPGAIISSNLFGIFFEEINFAGEGGLYAEMVRNRSFYTATNANHAITYTSADPGIAVVDGQGNITGVGPGMTGIIATYANLGLSATQSVQVVYAPTALVHRYSFNEGTANDSVGNANGTLHGNATISGGQLVLPNTTSVAPAIDYLQLPAGILTNSLSGTNNDPAVTVEAWATIKAGQYTWANLFDFGNQDAGACRNTTFMCVFTPMTTRRLPGFLIPTTRMLTINSLISTREAAWMAAPTCISRPFLTRRLVTWPFTSMASWPAKIIT